jgi:mRNA interferase MazF
MKPGAVLLVDFSPTIGREQYGVRPAVVVAHERYAAIQDLTIVVPLTSTDQRQRHHIQIDALTEQVRIISHLRIGRQLGQLDSASLEEILEWVHRFIA